MSQTLAIMITMTTYGTWLRGDMRGWVDDGITLPPNPVLEQFDFQRLKHAPYRFPKHLRFDVGHAMGMSLTSRLNLKIHALCIQSWHCHFVVGASNHSISAIVKCAKDAVRWHLRLDRPIWGDGYDKRFCFDVVSVRNRVEYVERHNVEDGLAPRPYEFVVGY